MTISQLFAEQACPHSYSNVQPFFQHLLSADLLTTIQSRTGLFINHFYHKSPPVSAYNLNCITRRQLSIFDVSGRFHKHALTLDALASPNLQQDKSHSFSLYNQKFSSYRLETSALNDLKYQWSLKCQNYPYTSATYPGWPIFGPFRSVNNRFQDIVFFIFPLAIMLNVILFVICF